MVLSIAVRSKLGSGLGAGELAGVCAEQRIAAHNNMRTERVRNDMDASYHELSSGGRRVACAGRFEYMVGSGRPEGDDRTPNLQPDTLLQTGRSEKFVVGKHSTSVEGRARALFDEERKSRSKRLRLWPDEVVKL